MNFISDINKELLRDINGQVIYFYSISEKLTKTHDVYNEAINKQFENPIILDALVDAIYNEESEITRFGSDQKYKLTVYLQYRDLIDKNVEPKIGDFFSFSDIFYEISNINIVKNIYGQAEHKNGITLTGIKTRETQLDLIPHGPTDLKYDDPEAVQRTFVQQRGESETSDGLTGDKRDLVSSGVLEKPLTGPKEVSERGSLSDNSHYVSSFLDEDV